MLYSLFMYFVLIVFAYLALPVVIFCLSSSRFGTSPLFRRITPPVAGIIMGLYCCLGFSLARRFLGFDENILSYSYPGDPFQMGMSIAGVISGLLFQISTRLETSTGKVLFICGVLILVFMSFITGVLIIAPE
jgi:hypothetical protein